MKKKINSLNKGQSIILSLIITLLFCCVNPIITEKDIIQIEDMIAPELTLYTPPENGTYAAMIIIEGVVIDFATLSGTKGKVTTLTYEVIGTNIKENIDINDDGFFSHVFPSSGLDPTITLKVTAKDWNNNLSVITRTLEQGAFPGFIVVPGNQEVTLFWDEVTQADSYTLYYTNDGSTPAALNPSAITKEKVKSPFSLTKLENGLLYSFILKANATQGPDNYSDTKTGIPLSSFTLAPRETGEYGRIRVEWEDIPGATRYIVQKDTLKTGSFSVSSGQLNQNFYYDTNISIGQGYYYRVIPANQDTISSEPNYAESSPFPPLASLVGIEDTPHQATDIVIKGDYAYIADWDSGLQVMSIANPAHPSIVGSLDTPGNARGICINGNYAYIADDGGGLQIIDITTPHSPELILQCIIPGSCCDVIVAGIFAYVAAGDEGLYIVDITDPEDPLLRGIYDSPGEAMAVTVEGNYACIADGSNGLVIIDISDPDNPEYFSSLNDDFDFALDVVLNDRILYMTTSKSGLRIIDVSNPASPSLSRSFNTGGTATRVALWGDYAYIADDEEGLHIIYAYVNDDNEVSEPTLITSYKTTGRALGCATDGEFTYIAYEQQGIHIVNTASPASLQDIRTYTLGGKCMDIAIQGDYAYIADETDGLVILDISNPESPIQVGSLPISEPQNVESIQLCGDYAFLSGYNIGFIIVDISDLSSLVEINWYDLNIMNATSTLFISGEIAYVTYRNNDGASGMEIISIANPTLLVSIGLLTPTATGGLAYDLFVSGDKVFIADGSEGLTVVDISNVDDLSIIDSCSTPHTAVHLASDNTYLYVATGTSGLRIIDPAVPEIVGAYETTWANNIELQGDYAFVADIQGGITIIDITSPTNPIPAGLWPTQYPYYIYGITVSGSYAYAGYGSSSTGGMIIYDLFPRDSSLPW